MAQAQRGFQDPSYVTRQSAFLGPVAAGSGGVTTKFTAHAALLLFDLTTNTITLGTSTYSATTSGQQINVITIVNTSTTTTVALSTTTYGPFLAGGQGTAAAQVGGSNQFVLNTTTGTAGYGGVLIPQGSLFYCVSGTDATAVTNCTIGYQINTGAGLTV